SFGRESPHHKRARQYLARRDGLTGLQLRDNFLKALDEESAYSEWIEQPLSIARYEIRGPNRPVSDPPTLLAMLTFRRAATRVSPSTQFSAPPQAGKDPVRELGPWYGQGGSAPGENDYRAPEHAQPAGGTASGRAPLRSRPGLRG